MNSIKAVVIDDESSNIDLIVRLITELSKSFEVVGKATSVHSGYNVITRTKPDVVFLDIKMPDGNGFSLLEMFNDISFQVIFISGFDSYALKAFEFNAIDYILKPIDPDKFEKALLKVKSRIEGNINRSQELKSILGSYDLSELIIAKIRVHSGNKVLLIAISDIVYIKSDEGYTVFQLISNERFTSSK